MPDMLIYTQPTISMTESDPAHTVNSQKERSNSEFNSWEMQSASVSICFYIWEEIHGAQLETIDETRISGAGMDSCLRFPAHLLTRSWCWTVGERSSNRLEVFQCFAVAWKKETENPALTTQPDTAAVLTRHRQAEILRWLYLITEEKLNLV